MGGVNRYYGYSIEGHIIYNVFTRGIEWIRSSYLSDMQKKALINFLQDAGLLTKNRSETETFAVLKKLYANHPDFVWAILWVNLAINSTIFKLFAKLIPWGDTFVKKEFETDISLYLGISESTARVAVSSLCKTIEKTPLKNWLCFKNRDNQFIKQGIMYPPNPYPFTSCELRHLIAYSLYKFAEIEGVKSTTVSELYSPEIKAGPYAWFGILRTGLEKILRGLRDAKLIDIELVADLDNIHFKEGLTSIGVLRTSNCL